MTDQKSGQASSSLAEQALNQARARFERSEEHTSELQSQ